MTSFNQRECAGCGQPFDGFYCYLCTCQQCGVNLINGICLNCTYGDGKPATCCGCEGPLKCGFCSFCALRAEDSFVYDPNRYSFDDTSNVFTQPPQIQYETYLYEFIKSSVEDLVPIPSESEDTPGSDSGDDESLSDEDVLKDNVKIYSNPIFEFNDEYISSDVNPFFDEVLEEIECKDSYDSNLDESTFLVTPLFDFNEDECFTPGDDVELLLHRDPSTPKMSVVSILKGFTDEPPLEEMMNCLIWKLRMMNERRLYMMLLLKI
uniref:Pre-mRNA splicing Prp18-interacting factor n=1 Tax=Tanacetum cinerariifolium TaxID=118510 RepID=A0A6L2M2S7_TANCI|nr:hypothetical protein [Tanacetum cinerariifolium]